MSIRSIVSLVLAFVCFKSFSQTATVKPEAKAWADSIYKTLSNEERIAQLMVVRLSTYDSKTKLVTFFEDKVDSLIAQYNIGGICIFQGSPVKQAEIINRLQTKAKTPILMCIDAEWGVGMRMIDSVLPLPRQMMLGAMQDASIMYQYGKLVGEQCKRVGIQVNYAPVVDVNNNPNNPVINDRSFGEDKYKVANYGIQYMKGMQDVGVMACAKHFPGHGDVDVDSHYDLPVINKTMAQLDSLELYPFRQIFNAGIGSVMIAHLYIPAIDTTANRATSLSPQNIKGLLRNNLGYQGLTFTDALEMQGVKKFFPNGAASVQSLIAGNDMLCLPGDVPLAIMKIKEAIDSNQLSWTDIETHCKKVLESKYEYGLNHYQPINTHNLTIDLNEPIPAMRKLVAENAITLALKKDDHFFPLSTFTNNKQGDVAFIIIGSSIENAMAQRMKSDYNASIFYAADEVKSTEQIDSFVNKIKKDYKNVIIGIHNLSRSPATNFGLLPLSVKLVNELEQKTNSIIFQFGNAYASKNWCNAKNLVVCYEDDDIVQQVAVDMLQGKIPYKGVLPVTVCKNLPFGLGIKTSGKESNINQWNMDMVRINKIDSIANDAISKKAAPGCVVLILKDGKIAFQKAYGNYTYDEKESMTIESVFDMASVTKICATTLSIMKLYEEGKIDLKKKLGNYLPFVKGTNKENLSIEKILLHQAGLVSYIPFYKETLDEVGKPLPTIYSNKKRDSFNIRVANNLYLADRWADTIKERILKSPLGPEDKYVYSDNDFIFLSKVVEEVAGITLDAYVKKEFYTPMSLASIGFKPLQKHSLSRIVPTEDEKKFRMQLIRGDVHDPGAAMMGGIAGHAGLFSNAYDIAAVMQMLMNGGTYNGKQYLQKETIELFTDYHSNISRRGYGFDKPEKDNKSRKEPYPTLSASPKTFGHTGFTGTCVWADPASNLVYVFLSNRVNPSGSDVLLKMNVRPKIHETIYQAIFNTN
jgi:beta-glucosidase-like glycosyl hydrolase/CubicO group peptidase (beta-lactamase class C family)